MLEPMRPTPRSVAFTLCLPLAVWAAEPTVPQDGKLSLEVGAQKVLQKPGLARLAVGDPTVVDVEVQEKERVQLTGLRAGRTTLLLWKETGERESVTVSVDDTPKSGRLTSLGLTGPDPSEPLELRVGATLRVPLKGFTHAQVGDPAVCELRTQGDGAVLLTGKTAGETTLEVSTGGMEVVYDVFVTDERTDAPVAQTLRLEVGLERVLTLSGIERVAVGDPKICDVKTVGGHQLLVVGASVGRTTLLVWPGDGRRLAWEVVVAARRPRPDATAAIDEETHVELRLVVGHTKSLAIPGVERVSLGDPAIADVELAGHDRLRVVGLQEGTTSLWSWNAKGQNTPITVIVAPEAKAEAAPLTDVTPEPSETLELEPGGSLTRELPGLRRAVAGDRSVAEVRVAGERLTVSGKAPGETMLLLWGKGASRFAWRVVVRAR